ILTPRGSGSAGAVLEQRIGHRKEHLEFLALGEGDSTRTIGCFPGGEVREPDAGRRKLSGEIHRCKPVKLLLHIVANEVFERHSILVGKTQSQMRSVADECAIL